MKKRIATTPYKRRQQNVKNEIFDKNKQTPSQQQHR